MDEKKCWFCGSEDVVYVDVLGCRWCSQHYQEFFVDEKK